MKPNIFALLYHKVYKSHMKINTLFLKCRGAKIGDKSSVEKITCEWPGQLIIGSNCIIQNNVDFRLSPYNKESTVIIHDNVFVGHACEFVSDCKIEIGRDCFIASKTTINTNGHEFFKGIKIKDQPLTIKEIIIEEDVWVGTSCVILQGVTIGKGAVVAAGSVVNKSIPAYEVWAGVPAKFIKNRV
jgi:acetyltransferase-like isoleucine patch superfamily enzyme